MDPQILLKSLFFFSFLRHECTIFRVETKMEYLETMAQTDHKELALGLTAIMQSRKIPLKQVFYNPLSIAHALDPDRDRLYKHTRY